MAYRGSVSGSLVRMSSYFLEAFGGQTTMCDVYLPRYAPYTTKPAYAPAVAQISLSHCTDQQVGCSAEIHDFGWYNSDGEPWERGGYGENSVYMMTMFRVSFSLMNLPGEGLDYSWSAALANVFQFAPDAAIDPSAP